MQRGRPITFSFFLRGPDLQVRRDAESAQQAIASFNVSNNRV
jgi:hypothetical protein